MVSKFGVMVTDGNKCSSPVVGTMRDTCGFTDSDMIRNTTHTTETLRQIQSHLGLVTLETMRSTLLDMQVRLLTSDSASEAD